jgi:hypothetical protein
MQTKIEQKEESETKTVAEREKETSPNQKHQSPSTSFSSSGVAYQVSLPLLLSPLLYSLSYPSHIIIHATLAVNYNSLATVASEL